jgi:hypothetical protein
MADGLTAFFSYKTQKICMYQGQTWKAEYGINWLKRTFG